MPQKGDLAFHTGVSKGTIQNVFRLVEDYGLVESKQKVGTYIAEQKHKAPAKLTSKRELAAESIKKYLLENNYKAGDYLISIRKLSRIIQLSPATIRIAISSLISENIIKKENNVFIINTVDFNIQNIHPRTLVEKIAEKIKTQIMYNYNTGEKLPANFELAKTFNVSIKTIHDSIKLLSKEGLLFTRRGRYGTIVINNNKQKTLYNYERVEVQIKDYIRKNCEIGAKLPSIIEQSKKYNVSAKTIKKALDSLSEEGYVTFVRGRYGGTFITDIPQNTDAYKWLAINPDFISNT